MTERPVEIVPAEIMIVSMRERPDLAPLVAQWLWDAFWRDDGYSAEETLAAVLEAVTDRPMPRCFVLLANGAAVGTASLVADDMAERPELTPWLAGVFVAPAARGRGYAGRLVDAVERAARAAGHATLWLYTSRAERIYARIGWERVEALAHRDMPVVLMRRTLMPEVREG